jgi:hypothetical protein
MHTEDLDETLWFYKDMKCKASVNHHDKYGNESYTRNGIYEVIYYQLDEECSSGKVKFIYDDGDNFDGYTNFVIEDNKMTLYNDYYFTTYTRK